jgi:hypothetical protein
MQKYQDNYNLTCFLRKAFPEENPPVTVEAKENSSTSQNKDRVSRPRFKVVPPAKPIQPVLRKEEPQVVTNEELDELQNSSHRKLRDIEGVIKESRTNREKLDKIAAILNLQKGRQPVNAIGTMTQDGSGVNALSIEASYKRFLRPSITEKSSFFNKRQPLSLEKVEERGKVELSYPRQGEGESIPPSAEFEGEMLLSQKKDPESEKRE